MSLRQRRFLFIITYGRSGSTLLVNFLNKLPDFLIRGENAGMLLHLWRASKASSKMKSKGSLRSLRPTHPWFGAARARASDFERDMQESFVDNILRPGGARTIGDKNIVFGPNMLSDEEFHAYIDWLLTWPNAQIIFNVRKIGDTASSGWWANWDRGEAERHLDLTLKRFAAAAERHPGSCRLFSYDDFVADPQYAATFSQFFHVNEDKVVRCAKSALAQHLPH